jgi:eukaryotic-like serine/threonine-protein kinase
MVDVSPTLTTSWEFSEGESIGPGRSVLRRLRTSSEVYDPYLVWDEHRFAITVAKVIQPQYVGVAWAKRAMQREWKALKRLHHPIVVRAFDAVHTGPHPHILLEHLEGFTLREVVRREGPLPIEQVLPLALHLASALHYFAGEGFVHMDIKPANVIMAAPARLIDLSLVHSVKENRTLKHYVGTDAWMSPEQCLPGEGPLIAGPADVWGMCATLHYACTGSVPFPRPSEDERYTLADRFPQLEDDPMPLPPGVPPLLEQMIKKGLSRRPEDRPTASEFAMALQPLVAELPHRFVMTKGGWQPRT